MITEIATIGLVSGVVGAGVQVGVKAGEKAADVGGKVCRKAGRKVRHKATVAKDVAVLATAATVVTVNDLMVALRGQKKVKEIVEG
jgi:hypothetical protein